MSILYVGDLHGRSERFHIIEKAAIEAKVSAIIQVGDLGIFWPGDPRIVKYFEKRARQKRFTIPWFFIDGNHDNHEKIESSWKDQTHLTTIEIIPGLTHIRRGTAFEIDGVMHAFCGGAKSTDRGPGREFYEGKRIWWPGETPRIGEIELFFNTIEKFKPDVVVTHDAPSCVEIYRDGRNSDSTAQSFDRIYSMNEHKPTTWFFGHHHVLRSWNVNKTTFACAGFHGQYWIRENDGTMTSGGSSE